MRKIEMNGWSLVEPIILLDKYKPDPAKSLSCTICGADTEFENLLCFDCICDMQEGSSERIRKSVRHFREKKDAHTIEDILLKVSVFTGISIDFMVSKNRRRIVVEPRQIAHYLSVKMKCGSLAFIGAKIGGKDHATVLHSCKTISILLTTDKAFLKKYGELIDYYL